MHTLDSALIYKQVLKTNLKGSSEGFFDAACPVNDLLRTVSELTFDILPTFRRLRGCMYVRSQ